MLDILLPHFIMANIVQRFIHTFARRLMAERTDVISHRSSVNPVYKDHIARYNFAALFTVNKAVLDIACGEGYGTTILAEKAKSVIGVDLSKSTIDEAKSKYQNKKSRPIEFIHSDAIGYLRQSKQKFDVIVTYETIEHIKEFKTFLKLAKTRLKSGGLLMISTPNKQFSDLLAGDTFNPYHVREFYSSELTNILTRTFGQKPQVYCQRPVQKNHLFWSFLQAFIKKESFIVKETPEITGIDMIYLVYKNNNFLI